MIEKHCRKEGCSISPIVEGYCIDHFMDEPYPMDDIEIYQTPEEELQKQKKVNKARVSKKKQSNKSIINSHKEEISSKTRENANQCGVKECPNEKFEEDFCKNHYNLIFKQMSTSKSSNDGNLSSNIPKTCIVEGCLHLEHHFGLCEVHYVDLSELENFKSDEEIFVDRKCAIEDCDSKRTKVLEDSCFCKSHHDELANKIKKEKKIKKKTEKLCNVLECEEPRDTRLYCSHHAEYIKMGYDYDMKDWCSKPDCKEEAGIKIGKKWYCKEHGTCKVKYCRNEVHRGGLCKEHYGKKNETKTCKTMNCQEKVYKKGLCENHYSIAIRLERRV
ncbi:hypothetical protein ACQUY5_30845 [Bacillus cereus]|uniref:hypothetical protein n=1 Tax=Bacillus cereus TaxID=1396 RepID=UPI003D165B13